MRRNAVAGASQPAGEETSEGFVGPFVAADGPSEVQKAELSDEDRELLNEARLAQMMTDDPGAYEQEMIDALVNH
jgi:hypothetical protein